MDAGADGRNAGSGTWSVRVADTGGAPPWRFWVSGPRFRLLRRAPPSNGGHLPSGSVQRAPRSQVVVPGGRGPGPPGPNGYEPPPQDATPRSAFRIVSRRRPSMSEAATL